MSYFLFESECKGTTKNPYTQIFLKKNAKKCVFFIFFGKNRVYRLHFATVASRRDPLVGGVIEGTNVSLNARA